MKALYDQKRYCWRRVRVVVVLVLSLWLPKRSSHATEIAYFPQFDDIDAEMRAAS
jgi:hypothetical protein